MQHTTLARNEIAPLLDHLIRQLDQEGRATQRAYFARLRSWLEHAADNAEVAARIRELSVTEPLGFQFSQDTLAIVRRISEKTQSLAEALDRDQPSRH